MLSDLITSLRTRLEGVQSFLSFDGWKAYPLFATKWGAGRAAWIGTGLGLCWGLHVGVGMTTVGCWWWLGGSDTPPRLVLAWQWCAYATAVSTFHLAEYFTTALANPSAATADSFLVNHSTGYTAAALTSWTEFGLRCAWRPTYNLPTPVVAFGLVLVLVAQTIRSLAMMTAGPSFNHIIQTKKKDNHVLITHGIYSVLRHPSYVGFYYWSIGTQLLLGNALHAVLLAAVAWRFFARRIPYEEESLCQHFPAAYPAYVARTYMGIPFLQSNIQEDQGKSD